MGDEAVPARVPDGLLRRTLEARRVHSAYLLAGPGAAPREAALAFARGLACTGAEERPCEACDACRRSRPGEAIALDGAGKSGPRYRHVGDHPDLFWVERGADDTRVRIGQIRALQNALRLQSHEGGGRAAVVADAEWLNLEAQNALLRLLEEPPDATTLVLVTASPAGLLATVRSRCQRVTFPPDPVRSPSDPDAPPEVRELAERLDALAGASLPRVLDWAEEYRGARAPTASAVDRLLATGCAWLRERVRRAVAQADDAPPRVEGALDAFHTLRDCRRALVQRNANPQMVAERALFALREAASA